MKKLMVMSWNCNFFNRVRTKNVVNDAVAVKKEFKSKVEDFLKENKNAAVFLYETPKSFLEELRASGAYDVFFHDRTGTKAHGYTGVIVRKNSGWKEVKNGFQLDKKIFNPADDRLFIECRYEGKTFLGIHSSFKQNEYQFWKLLEQYAVDRKTQKISIFGDMNVHISNWRDETDPSIRDCYLYIRDTVGYSDSVMNKITYFGACTTIDHVLTKNMDCNSDVIPYDLSDHACIISHYGI